MENKIINILWEVGKIPKEITQFYIIPKAYYKCGCWFINKKCKNPKIIKRSKWSNELIDERRKCLACKIYRTHIDSHYCQQCKCQYSQCYELCHLYEFCCKKHLNSRSSQLNPKPKRPKAIKNRLDHIINYKGDSSTECYNYAIKNNHKSYYNKLIYM